MATKQNEVRFLMRKLYLNANIYFKPYISPERQMKIHLRQMLRHYKQWRQLVKDRKNWWNTQTEKERIDEFERYIVHYLLAICFWTSYEDSDVVSNLLSTLYDTDQRFEELLGLRPMRLLDSRKYGLEDLTRVTLTVRHPWSDIGESEDSSFIRYLERWEQQEQRIDYFVKHGFKEKLFFLRFGEHWLRNKIEHIAFSWISRFFKLESVFFNDPDILSKFLEYGLLSNVNKRDATVERLLKGIVEIWYKAGFRTEYPFSTHSKRNAKALEVAAMLLRAVKSVDISVLCSFIQIQLPNEVLRTIVSEASEEILPMLKTRCIGPQKLQHLCRWEIRKQMCDCGQIPDGIYQLPIPKFLQEYLGLRHDE